MLDKYERKELLKLAAYELLTACGADLNDKNFSGTPERFAKAMDDLIWPQERIDAEIEKIMDVAFPSEYQGMIFCKNIRAYSFCPHHILPIAYDVHVGYIPEKDGLVLGASKLVRLVTTLCKRFVLQEQLTKDIADTLVEHIRPDGVAVVMRGVHDCMLIRGVMQQNSTFDTSEMVGSFRENPKTRDEFFHMVMAG